MNRKIPIPVPQTRPCAWVVNFYRTTYTDTKSAGTLDQSEGCRDGPAAGEHVIDNQHTFVRLDCLGVDFQLFVGRIAHRIRGTKRDARELP